MGRARLIEASFEGPLSQRLEGERSPNIVLHWLGQAGFVITTPGHRLVIDPYLSDSLAIKYRATATPHDRMMAPPVTPAELGAIDLLLCTHHHTDHMDGDTLHLLVRLNPDLRIVIPRAALSLAKQRIGVGDDRLVGVDAGEAVEALPNVLITALRAAHETLETDNRGHHRFLGYCIETSSTRLFHSGDTVPFAGQVEEVSAFAPDCALLPVNGRSERLRAMGIAGNLTIAEAIDLCRACGIPAMIAHHYGMFAFNTADPEEIDKIAATAPVRMLRATPQMEYVLQPG
jgi:L-ascorbate metabolism protein UlaG (beta-lactamase superfamily)